MRQEQLHREHSWAAARRWRRISSTIEDTVRIGIEPLMGLNSSWDSLLPMLFNQATVSALCGAFLARVKPSATTMNPPLVPGWETQPKSTLSLRLALLNSPCAQSPIDENAQRPSSTALIAWSQVRAE